LSKTAPEIELNVRLIEDPKRGKKRPRMAEGSSDGEPSELLDIFHGSPKQRTTFAHKNQLISTLLIPQQSTEIAYNIYPKEIRFHPFDLTELFTKPHIHLMAEDKCPHFEAGLFNSVFVQNSPQNYTHEKMIYLTKNGVTERKRVQTSIIYLKRL